MKTDFDLPRLDPPQRRKNKWVEFQENDVESQILPEFRRFSVTGAENRDHSVPVIYSVDPSSSSISSDTASLSSSLGSAGDCGSVGSPPHPPRPADSSSRREAEGAVSFNSSFGGFTYSGEPVSLRSKFPAPRRNAAKPRLTSVSSSESVGSASTTTSIRVTDFNEISDLEAAYSELVLESGETEFSQRTVPEAGEVRTCKYSALEDIRDRSGVYTGWSNTILGQVNGWSEQIKSDNPAGGDNQYLTCPAGGQVYLDTSSSPDIPSLTQITWPKSPSRTFVRNFP